MTSDRSPGPAKLMLVSSDRTGLMRKQETRTWANALPLVAANVPELTTWSLLVNTEPGSGPRDAVRTGEHSRSLLANEIKRAPSFLPGKPWL